MTVKKNTLKILVLFILKYSQWAYGKVPKRHSLGVVKRLVGAPAATLRRLQDGGSLDNSGAAGERLLIFSSIFQFCLFFYTSLYFQKRDNLTKNF